MKKISITLVAVLLSVMLFSFYTEAKCVSTLVAENNGTAITVSGTTESGVLAVAIMIYSGDELTYMETCSCNNSQYSCTLNKAFADGAYEVKVADYDGGAFVSQSITIQCESEAQTPSSDDADDDDSPSGEEKVMADVEYTVVKGDTLGKIARRNNLTLSALLAMNPQIRNINLIYPGQKIVVGHTARALTGQAAASVPANAEYYVVQKGDCLYWIARRNGLSLSQLAALNPEIMKQKYVYAGQKIRIR